MSEGTHSTPETSNWSNRLRDVRGNKPALTVAGLGIAVLAAGLVIQVFRAEPGTAAEERSSQQQSSTGTARVSASQPMAKVGEHVITYDVLARELVERNGKDVLDSLINRMVIQQACEQRGIQVTKAEVAQEVKSIAEKFKLDVPTWYQMLQAERDLSPIQYQRDIIWPMLALRKIAGEKVAITNEDRKKAYERDYGPRVEAKMIMLDNLRHAETVWRKATQEKEDFSRLAREFSIEPTSRALGGDIPPIRMHVGSPEVIKQAFKLQVGEISGIIQAGPSRYVILLCEGHTKSVAEYAEVREAIEENLLEEKRQEAVAKIFDQLKKEVRVDNYLTNTTSGGVRQVSGTKPRSAASGGEVIRTGRTAPARSKTSNVKSPIRR